MTDLSSSIFAALITLTAVVVGGVLTGWLGPSLLEGRKQDAEKRKRRAEKFEEPVTAVYEFDHWVDHSRRIAVFGEESSMTKVSPMAEIQAISAAYFPQLENQNSRT
jgi:hypothetical protein